MTAVSGAGQIDWPVLMQRVRAEVARLEPVEKEWLRARLAAIDALQKSLDVLFCAAGGLESCTDCDGACCRCGRHHFTLTNLLAFLLREEVPPAPDFDKTCPFLGKAGCVLPVAQRPYNCITFFCDRLEGRLSSEDQETLRGLDHQLRHEYQQVADRYPAASLRGLWIALERIGSGRILRSNREDMLE